MSDPSDVVRTLEIEPLRGDEVMHSRGFAVLVTATEDYVRI